MSNAKYTHQVEGNTYPARQVLRAAGFEWIAQMWLGTAENAAELDRITHASYSRANAKACKQIKVVEVACG